MVITSQPQMAGFPLTLELQNMGLPKQSWVKINQIRTLSVVRLGKKIAHLPPEILDQIIDGLNEIVA
jgi:mRNA interferase MazF